MLLVYVFGFWVSTLGKPYHGLLFNLHKLIALGAVILGVIRVSNLLKDANIQFVMIALAAVCVLCIVVLFATGALMSVGRLRHAPLLIIHRIALTALPLAVTSMLYFLTGGK